MSTIAQTVKPKETLNFAHLAHRSVKDKASLENLIIVKKGLGAWHNKMCTVDYVFWYVCCLFIYIFKDWQDACVFCFGIKSQKNNMTKKLCNYTTSSIDILFFILLKTKEKSIDLFLLSTFRWMKTDMQCKNFTFSGVLAF